MTETDMTNNTENTNANWQSLPPRCGLFARIFIPLFVLSLHPTGIKSLLNSVIV